MRKFAFLTLLSISLCFCSIHLNAQWYELGLMVGGSNYIGDISPEGMAPEEYNLSFGIHGRYNYNKFVSFKAFFNKAKITGDDRNNSYLDGLRQRNLSFRSNILELGIVNEFNLTPYHPRDDKGTVPYVFLGVSGFYYNPQAEFKGSWYDLRPLGTEGQGNLRKNSKAYNSIGFAVPFGFGFKWNITQQVNLGAEFGMRLAVTDYLDDVSGAYPDIDELRSTDPLAATLSFRTPEFTVDEMENPQGNLRGNPDTNDWYFIGGITLSINLTDKYGMEWEERYKQFSTDERESFFGKRKKVVKYRSDTDGELK